MHIICTTTCPGKPPDDDLQTPSQRAIFPTTEYLFYAQKIRRRASSIITALRWRPREINCSSSPPGHAPGWCGRNPPRGSRRSSHLNAFIIITIILLLSWLLLLLNTVLQLFLLYILPPLLYTYITQRCRKTRVVGIYNIIMIMYIIYIM